MEWLGWYRLKDVGCGTDILGPIFRLTRISEGEMEYKTNHI
jgi:hypothetical protein